MPGCDFLQGRLQQLDVFIESPGALERPEFVATTQTLLDGLGHITQNEITKLRGKVR